MDRWTAWRRPAARCEVALSPKVMRAMRFSVRRRRPHGSESKRECCATAVATEGCATCSNSARPPPSRSTASRLTRQVTLPGPNRPGSSRDAIASGAAEAGWGRSRGIVSPVWRSRDAWTGRHPRIRLDDAMGRAVEESNRRMLRARDAMDRDYEHPLDIPRLAKLAYVSEAHFIRTFRATFGETPHRYLQRRRVERAM